MTSGVDEASSVEFRVRVNFPDQETRKKFMIEKGCIIIDMKNNGRFEGEVKPSDLIRENFVLHMEATPTVERTPVQQTTGYQVNKSESITLQPERYPVGDEQLVPMQDSNSNALYIPNESVDPLSESSQSRPLSSDTKLQQPSSVSTGSANEQSSSTTDQTKALGIESSLAKSQFESTKEKQHTIYCVLHGIESSIGKYYATIKECKAYLDETFANGFKQLLGTSKQDFTMASLKSTNYLEYIIDHLQSKKCPNLPCKLWRFCAIMNISSVFQYADETLLVFSKHRNDIVGKSCKDYVNLQEKHEILGKGTFGKVYLCENFKKQLAVKVRPLAKINAKLFKKIINLKHQNVIEILEYLIDPAGKDGKQLCYFVMPLMNKRDLNKQFNASCKCVLDFMKEKTTMQNVIFRNYLALFCQVFEALSYLKSQQIVHRDIKSSNILVNQMCNCQSAMLCTHDVHGAQYLLSDLDSLCFEEPYSTRFEEWRVAQCDPTGTVEMRPPEAFCKGHAGKHVLTSHKSDVWSGSLTMMYVLVGLQTKRKPHDQVKKYLKHTISVESVSGRINDCCTIVKNLFEKHKCLVDQSTSSMDLNNEISKQFETLEEWLDESSKSLKKIESFQGKDPEVFKEDNPLAGILSTVYVANSLHWVCLGELPDIYNTTLWNCMRDTLNHIADGVRIFPVERPDASSLLELLEPLQEKVMSK